MARRMVGDHQDVFRVVVVQRKVRPNPDYVWGGDQPRMIPAGGEHTTHTYGPYNTLGAARGQLTGHTRGYGGELLAHVVSGHIEKATTSWAVVNEG